MKGPTFEVQLFCNNCANTWKDEAPKFYHLGVTRDFGKTIFAAYQCDSCGVQLPPTKRFDCPKCGLSQFIEVRAE